MFRPVPPDVDLIALEEGELAHWKENEVFERSVAARGGAPAWVFFEGPPTANGRPGLHHVWARVYKDLFCRYRTMRGFEVARRAGWDTHGLPVEVEVEKKLGISGKRQIEEDIGIGEFVAECRASVLGYVEDWKRLTERIGYWVDLDAAYWTFDSEYVQSVWWHLKQLFDQGLLYEGLKVVPYCPRCGTALSSHELGQPGVYTDEEDESAYVRFELVDPAPDVVGSATSLVVWTTTPWTLLSNTGVAVHPELVYAVVDGMVVAEALVESVFGQDAVITHRMVGRELAGVQYRRPFDDVDPGDSAGVSEGWKVVLADFVVIDEGTGLVHLAPAFGEIDRQVGQSHGLPVLNPVGPDGCFTDAVAWLAGQPVRETNSEVNDRLTAAGLLVRRALHVHSYPHCWRCGTALIYWGKPSWYIATSSRKSELLAANRTVEWHPAHIRDGRFGEWLENNVDWALSRDRYWGTPLPIWRCDEGHLTCIGSLDELSELTGRDVRDVDPHRPAIDEIEFACPTCTAPAFRVAPVIDAWFDSGSMPAAQLGYRGEGDFKAGHPYPADLVTEAIDQTRGWFYSLLAVNTLVHGAPPYRHVMCLGHIVDAEGKKMSKSIGNVIDPWDILSTRGSDALRWWMFSQGSPWTPTRVSLQAIDASMREMLLTTWNIFSFFMTYAALNEFDPEDPKIPAHSNRPALDRWALSRLGTTIGEVTNHLDAYEPLEATASLARLVDDLSNWYVRRSRRRFWRTDPDAPASDTLSAQATLHEILTSLAGMLAPFCPLVADRLWRDLTWAEETKSVHLTDWVGGLATTKPWTVALALGAKREYEGWIATELEEQMAQARRLASLGRAARSEAGVRVRQPLARALVHLPIGAPALLPGVVEDELNVDAVEVTQDLSTVLRFELVPNFKTLGPRLGELVKEVRPALGRLTDAEVAAGAAALEAGGSLALVLSEGSFELGADEVDLRVHGQPGYSASREGGEVVALDLALNEDLRRRGMSREVVRLVQDLRKSTGLEVSDRIRLHLDGLADLSSQFEIIGREVLAVEVVPGAGPGDGTPLELDGLGKEARAWIERVSPLPSPNAGSSHTP